jgi:Uma2 family endonuclease
MSQISPFAERETEPTWAIADLYPRQGEWSQEEYLALDTNHLVEFSDGYMEFLPMPTQSHQTIVAYLYRPLLQFVLKTQAGNVLFAPLRIQLWPGKFREPDIVFMLSKHDDRRSEQFWQGADLVMEVVSPDDGQRDEVIKKREYARAGIPEYWLVNPQKKTITVFRLEGTQYAVHGKFGMGKKAGSHLLPGFEVDVTAVFNARL